MMRGRGVVTMSAAAERLLRKKFGERLRMQASEAGAEVADHVGPSI